MNQKTDSPATPTPEQLEALKCAAAFAYGYCLTIYMSTYQPLYLERAKRLKEDLRQFGCLDETGQLNQPYFQYRLRGIGKATLELEKVGIPS